MSTGQPGDGWPRTEEGLRRREVLAGLACGAGAVLAGLAAAPARADTALDVQILQTASSLELLAVAAYQAALSLEAVRGTPALARFAQTTLLQHEEHLKAFQAHTKTLGGKEQGNPNPVFAPVLDQARPGLRAPLDVVNLGETLESLLTQTYLQNTAQLENRDARRLVASVMGVESQHAAVLRTFKALLEGGVPDLVRIPIGDDAAKLPAAAGRAAFPEPFEPVTTVAEPASGAVP
ncbi:MAG: ferritin-like domain-containing protein [Acidimicrobiales bacterium]